MVRCVNCAMMPDRHKKKCHAYNVTIKDVYEEMSCPRYKPKYRVQQVTAK